MRNISYKLHDKLFFLFLFLPFFLCSAFRNGLGTDYYTYADLYQNPDALPVEFLFKLLFITIPNLVSQNEMSFFILTSFVVSFFFLKTIFMYSPLISLSTLIYFTQFYFVSFNAIRQFTALALFLYFGAKFLNEKRLIFYYILVVLLAQFHFSMYLLLFFPCLGNHGYAKKIYWLVWLVSFLIYILQFAHFVDFSSILVVVDKLSFISEKFDAVSEASSFFSGLFVSSNYLLVKNLLCFGFLLKLRYFKGNDQIYWFNLFLFGIILNNILVNFSVFAVRVGYIGDIALLILIPLFIKSFKLKMTRAFLTVFFILGFLLTFYYKFVISGESGVFRKEQVIWGNEIETQR